MENFIVSARKYRPDSFETVVGQVSITRTLKNAIKVGQIAHAYLFCGPRGVGKTTCARIFAKTINCMDPGPEGEACNKCESCMSFQQNRSFNIHELDAASNNSVDDIRELIDQIRIPPQLGNYSIYIIDEVHMLSQAAFNAFLKTLEEPPGHAIFILATTEKHKIIPTILSRCQIYDFKRITVREMMSHLSGVAEKEGVKIDSTSLNIIAQKADGSMRDALSLFDQIVSFCGNDVDYQSVIDNLNVLDYDYYFRVTRSILEGDYPEVLKIFDEVLDKGFDSRNFLNGLGRHFRDLLMARDKETIELMELSGEVAEQYLSYAGKCTVDFLFKALEIIGNADVNFKQAREPRLHLEICLLKLTGLKPGTLAFQNPEADRRPDIRDESKAAPDRVKAPENASGSVKSQETSAGTIKTGPRIRDFIQNGKPSEETVQDVDEKVEEAEQGGGDLTQENLEELWRSFAEMIREDQPRLYNTLNTQKPLLADDSLIRLDLNNPLQEKALNSIHNEILAYLKSKTGKSEIKLETIVSRASNEKRLYTPEEKFRHLQEQNPQLGLFKSTFNLDFD